MKLTEVVETLGLARLIFIAFSIFIVLNRIRKVLLDPLRDVPGPFIARFSRLWLLREYINGNFHETNINLHQKYGMIVHCSHLISKLASEPSPLQVLWYASHPVSTVSMISMLRR
jgi:hypothetical protein